MHARTPLPSQSGIAAVACGGAILSIALGTRHGFGLFLQPVSMEHGWGREVFGFAVALSNLTWGLAQPFVGALADRLGARKVLIGGALLYTAGLVGMAHATTPLMLILSLGVLVGLGMSGVTFNVVLGALGRLYPAGQRSLVFGIASAAGSFGQFAMMPIILVALGVIGWYWALIALAVGAAVAIPLAFGIRDAGYATPGTRAGSTSREAFGLALGNRNFWLLGTGYFACGFQIVFVGTHFPAFLIDQGFTATHGTIALALIGFFNIFGSFLAGWAGSRWSNARLLAAGYASRAIVIALLISFPLTPASIYAFSIVLGMTWLATVPLTNGVIVGIWGVRHLAMLSGSVLFFHQLGSFFGGWLGGLIYDATGSYRLVWWIAIGLSIVATLVNLPIDERPVAAPAPA